MGTAGVLVALAFGLAVAAPARAGTLTHYVCKSPQGKASNSDGISAIAYEGYVSTDCAKDWAVWAALSQPPYNSLYGYPPIDYAGFVYRAPGGLRIRHIVYERSWWWISGANTAPRLTGLVEHDAPDGTVYQTDWYDPNRGGSATGEAPGTAATVTRPLDATWVLWSVACRHPSPSAGANGPNQCFNRDSGYWPMVAVSSAKVSLYENDKPTLGTVSGTLLSGGAQQGTRSLTAAGTDGQTGIYRAIVKLDGQVTRDAVLDPNGGRCDDAEPTNQDPYEFLHQQPCARTEQSRTLDIDTRELPEGTHKLTVQVEDAAGNLSANTFTAQVVIDNVSSPANVQRPQLVGSPHIGETLRVLRGEWTGASLSYRYQWQRCEADGSACQTIAGATSDQYTATAEDLERRLRAIVTAVNSDGETAAHSDLTEPVGLPSAGPPAVGLPVLAGTEAASSTGPAMSRGQANGHGAGHNAALRLTFLGTKGRTETVVGYGQPAEMEGTLRNATGQPIADAAVAMIAQPAAPGLPAPDPDSATTGNDGTFRWTAPPGVSRTIRASYRAFSEDRNASAEAEARLSVVATASLRANPKRARNGRTVRFTGTVAPAVSGMPVELQALASRREGWVKVIALKSARGGRFRFKYRFRNTPRTFTYRFRVVAGPAPTQALEAGPSRELKVKVLGGRGR